MKHVSFKGSQLTLFERLQAFGFDKFDAEFLVKFREVSARDMLKGFRRPPRALPKVKIDGKEYFHDARLRQFRNVDNPHDFID